MLKGSQITALALTLTSLLVGISTQIAYGKQSTQHPVDIVEDTEDPSNDAQCTPKPKKPCPVIQPAGNTPNSHRGSTATSTTGVKLNQEFQIVPAATPVKSGSN
jgi:hypothetical protein